MEVVRRNYKESLPKVRDSIAKADFLVIDAEFTGIIQGRDVTAFDSPSEYYQRLLKGSTDFLLIQFGLCAFYLDEKKNIYMNDAYNFYLFPRGKPGPEKIFHCQSSSLDFLCAQGFDFNKVIRDGISYMTKPDEIKLRENLIEKQKSYSKEKDAITIPDEHMPFIDETCKKVRVFIDEQKRDVMEIDRCNSFVRLLIYQELKLRFKNEILVETKVLENKDRLLQIIRIKPGMDTKSQETKRKEREWEELEDAVGFSKVAHMISHAGKLVIGHNMLLDVIHTLNHFFEPVPDDYISFKEYTHCVFPWILDTKYMSSLPPFKDKVTSSVLSHLLQTLSEPPFSLPKVGAYEGRGYLKSEDRLHQAGYDAYITGLCFLAMHSHMTKMRGEGQTRADPTSPVLKPFLNKLFLAKTAYQDSPYMNLTGPDPSPSREHVFHVTIPKEFTRNDINQLFSPFGEVYSYFIDDNQVLVALKRREQARVVARALASNARIILRPYDEYKLIMQSKSDANIEQLKRSCTITTKFEPKSNPDLSSNFAPPATSPPRPEKVARVRTNSETAPPSARKRTSSGVFQVDEAEPPLKKTEHVRTKSDGAQKKPKVLKNGRRRSMDEDRNEKLIIDKFESNVKTVCVTAFKESDSWD